MILALTYIGIFLIIIMIGGHLYEQYQEKKLKKQYKKMIRKQRGL